MISDINTSDAKLFEESKDFGGRLMHNHTSESIWQHTYPDCRVSGMVFPILNGLDGWDVVVGEVCILHSPTGFHGVLMESPWTPWTP
jgi:hypothetical protein